MAKFIIVGDRKFEVVADGRHDDSKAFSAAIAHAESIGGGKIKLPPGKSWGALPPQIKEDRAKRTTGE